MVDRNKAQPRRHSSVGKRFERGPLVVAQMIRHADQYANYTVLAGRASHRAVVAVNDHARDRSDTHRQATLPMWGHLPLAGDARAKSMKLSVSLFTVIAWRNSASPTWTPRRN